MTIIRSVITAFAMFSKIPMPNINWEKQNMKYTLAALPLVGAVVGVLMWLCLCFPVFDKEFVAVILTVIPLIVTGGIHLDGFCDTVDALSSHTPPEKKREILKDPRAGAFAVIWVCVYLLLTYGIFTELLDACNFNLKWQYVEDEPFTFFKHYDYAFPMLCSLIAVPVMSRAAGAFAGSVFSSSKSGVMLETLRGSASNKSNVVCAVFAVLFFFAGAVFAPISAVFIVLCTLYVFFMSKKEFGGMSGDIAGFLISISELAGWAGLMLWLYS
jgi:adenosylcobinamide-GDP ribazoletransferase